MRSTKHIVILSFAMLFIAACSSEPKNETPEQKEERVMDEAAECDPLVGEFRNLMEEYETALTEMVAAKKVDAEKQKELSAKAKDLGDRIQQRGEKALGLKCWSEFKTIGATYGMRIAKLGMQVAMMEGGMEGVDPEMIEQLQKVMQ
ncbi:MAG: hypothetical protein IPH21_02240 [Flavobacteriales bacterium]|nr:hypothetical protein [Flavobacteriales bacterium]